MSLDEAIMKMELLGHDFFIYTDVMKQTKLPFATNVMMVDTD